MLEVSEHCHFASGDECLSQIANKYRVWEEDVRTLNPSLRTLPSARHLPAGTVVKIMVAPYIAPEYGSPYVPTKMSRNVATTTEFKVLSSSETLVSVSRDFDVNSDEVRLLNMHLATINDRLPLGVGTVVTLPMREGQRPTGSTLKTGPDLQYEVGVHGETMESVCNRFRIDETSLRTLNPHLSTINHHRLLALGTIVTIPRGSSPTSPGNNFGDANVARNRAGGEECVARAEADLTADNRSLLTYPRLEDTAIRIDQQSNSPVALNTSPTQRDVYHAFPPVVDVPPCEVFRADSPTPHHDDHLSRLKSELEESKAELHAMRLHEKEQIILSLQQQLVMERELLSASPKDYIPNARDIIDRQHTQLEEGKMELAHLREQMRRDSFKEFNDNTREVIKRQHAQLEEKKTEVKNLTEMVRDLKGRLHRLESRLDVVDAVAFRSEARMGPGEIHRVTRTSDRESMMVPVIMSDEISPRQTPMQIALLGPSPTNHKTIGFVDASPPRESLKVPWQNVRVKGQTQTGLLGPSTINHKTIGFVDASPPREFLKVPVIKNGKVQNVRAKGQTQTALLGPSRSPRSPS